MAKIKVSSLAEEFGLDPKEVISRLSEAGIVAKRRNSSVDEEPARRVLSPDVVELPKTESRQDRLLREFYERYPHVVAGSVRQPTAEDRAVLDHCHGKVCDIRCVDTGDLRTINVQDTFQVRRTVAAQAVYLKRRRAERRAAKREAAKQALAS